MDGAIAKPIKATRNSFWVMMTNPKNFKQEKAQRLLQLFSQARQRYLESGGNPNH